MASIFDGLSVTPSIFDGLPKPGTIGSLAQTPAKRDVGVGESVARAAKESVGNLAGATGVIASAIPEYGADAAEALGAPAVAGPLRKIGDYGFSLSKKALDYAKSQAINPETEQQGAVGEFAGGLTGVVPYFVNPAIGVVASKGHVFSGAENTDQATAQKSNALDTGENAIFSALPLSAGAKIAERAGGGVGSQIAAGAASGAGINAALLPAVRYGENQVMGTDNPVESPGQLGQDVAMGALFGAHGGHSNYHEVPHDSLNQTVNADGTKSYVAPNGDVFSSHKDFAQTWRNADETARTDLLTPKQPEPEAAPVQTQALPSPTITPDIDPAAAAAQQAQVDAADKNASDLYAARAEEEQRRQLAQDSEGLQVGQQPVDAATIASKPGTLPPETPPVSTKGIDVGHPAADEATLATGQDLPLEAAKAGLKATEPDVEHITLETPEQRQATALQEAAKQPDAGPLTRAVGNNIEHTALAQEAPNDARNVPAAVAGDGRATEGDLAQRSAAGGTGPIETGAQLGRRGDSVGASDTGDGQNHASESAIAKPAQALNAGVPPAQAEQTYTNKIAANRAKVLAGQKDTHETVKIGDKQFVVRPKEATPESLKGQPIDKDWTAYAPDSGTLGVPRADMPQIKAEHRGALVNFLKARGIEHQSDQEVDPATLKPTQAEYSQAKVDKAKSYDGGDRSILVSSDNHVLDGHHQWMAKLAEHEPIKVIRLDAPIKDLLPVVKEFPSAETAPSPEEIKNVEAATSAVHDVASPSAVQEAPPEKEKIAAAKKFPQTEQTPAIADQDLAGEWQHKRLGDAKATVTKTEKGYHADFGDGDTQEFNGSKANEKLLKAMSKADFTKAGVEVPKEEAKPKGPSNKKTPLVDPNVKEYAGWLEKYAAESGWAQTGGKILRGRDGEVNGRTSWEPHAPWYRDFQSAVKLPGGREALMEVVRKAIAGEPLGKNEKLAVQWLIEHAKIERDGTAEEQAAEAAKQAKAAAENEFDPFTPHRVLDLNAVNLLPVEKNLIDQSIVDHAISIDEAAVEQASTKFADDDAAFMQRMQEIIDGHDQNDAGAEAGGVGETEPGVSRAAGQEKEGNGAEGFKLTGQTEAERQAEEARNAKPAPEQVQKPEDFKLTPQTKSEAVINDEAKREVTSAQKPLFNRSEVSPFTNADEKPATIADAMRANKLNTIIKNFMKVDIGAQAVGATGKRAEMAQTMKKLFDRDVVYFRSQNKFAPAGVYISGRTLFINADAKQPFTGIIGHELLHSLAAQDPALYKSVKDALLPLAKDGRMGEYGEKLNAIYKRDNLSPLARGKIEEEFVADLFGSVINDPKVLADVKAAMEPNLFRKVMLQLQALYERAIAAFSSPESKALNDANDQSVRGAFARDSLTDLQSGKKIITDALKDLGKASQDKRAEAEPNVAPAFARKDESLRSSQYKTYGRFAEYGDAAVPPIRARADAMQAIGIKTTIPMKSVDDMGAQTPARFNLSTRRIELNPNIKLGHGEMSQAITEEYLHALDAVSANRTISRSMTRFDPKTGDLYKEATDHYDAKEKYASYLYHPLGEVKLTESEVRAELFARLGTLYLADPAEFKQHFPRAYDAYSDVFRPTRSEQKSSNSLRGEIRPTSSGDIQARSESGRRTETFAGDGGRTGSWETDHELGRLRDAVSKAFGGDRQGQRVILGSFRTLSGSESSIENDRTAKSNREAATASGFKNADQGTIGSAEKGIQEEKRLLSKGIQPEGVKPTDGETPSFNRSATLSSTIRDRADAAKNVLGGDISAAEKIKQVGRGVLRAATAAQHQAVTTADRAVAGFQEHFDKRMKETGKDPLKNYADVIAFQKGEKVADPVARTFLDTVTKLLDKQAEQIRTLNPDALKTLRENYFVQAWADKDAEKASQLITGIMSKASFTGPKNFLKQRVFDNYEDGIKAGFKPRFENPVDAFMARYAQGEKYLSALRIQKDLADRGYAKEANTDRDIPNGYSVPEDRSFRKIIPIIVKDENGKQSPSLMQKVTAYPDQITKDINNLLDPGLNKFAAWRTFRGVQNLMLSARLGLSAFHAGFTSSDVLITHVDRSMRQLIDGDVGGALRTLSHADPFHSYREGKQLLEQFLGVKEADPQTQAVFDALIQGGTRAFMDPTDTNNSFGNFLRAIRQGDKAGAAMKGIPALLEGSSRWISHKLVPYQKMVARVILAKQELDNLGKTLGTGSDYAETLKKVNPDVLRQIMSKVVDSVDDRLGQFAYDNTFWNKTLKSMAQAMVQSVGWNFGTARVIGGGLADTRRLFSPEKTLGSVDKEGKIGVQNLARVTNRMSYLISMNATVGLMGAALQYLLTGEGPDDVKDMFFPRTGRKNADGSAERLSIPSYVKDEFAFAKHPLETVQHKLHPFFSEAAELWQNKDFYGTQIINPDHDAVHQAEDLAGYILKGFTPYAVTSAVKSAQTGQSLPLTLAPFVGVAPAPASITRTKFQDFVADNSFKGAAARTQEQADASKAKHDAETAIRRGEKPDLTAFTPKERFQIQQAARKEVPEIRFHQLSFADKLKAYDMATDQEKQEYKLRQIIMKSSTHALQNASPEDRPVLLEKLKEVRSAP